MRVPVSIRLLTAAQSFLLLASLLLPALASAATIQTDLFVYQDGDTVTVTGVEFGADEVVDFVTTDPDGTIVDSGAATTDDAGSVSYAFVLHTTVSGLYTVTGTGETSALTASVQFDPSVSLDSNIACGSPYCFTSSSVAVFHKSAGQLDVVVSGSYNCTSGANCTTNPTITATMRVSDGASGFTGSIIGSPSFVGSSGAGNTNWSLAFAFRASPSAGQFNLNLVDGFDRLYDVQVSMACGNCGTLTSLKNDYFRIDAAAPAAPSVTSTSPNAATNNNNTPKVIGSAEAGSTINLYSNDTCTSTIAATGTAANFASPGLTINVADNSTSTIWATATDAAGNVSPCSSTSVTYVEDSSAPLAPTVSGTTPASPSMASPTVNGTAEAGSTVTLYAKADCSGSAQGTATATGGSWSIPASVGANSTTTFAATATDAAGNTSGCSGTNATYVRDNSAPSATILTHPTNPSASTNADFTFSGTDTGSSASGVDYFECSLDGSGFATCPSPFHQVVGAGPHSFQVRAVDNAGNVGAAATFGWTVNAGDTTAPDTSISSHPSNPSATGSAAFSFTGTDDTTPSGSLTFECKLDAALTFTACTSGQSYSSLPDGSHTFAVRAKDAVGNTDASPASFTWVVDTTAPVITKSIHAGPTYHDGSNDLVTNATVLRVNIDESGSGLNACIVSIDGPGSADSGFLCANGNNDFSLADLFASPPDGSYTVSVSATDVAGNENDDPLTVVLDDTAPTYGETVGSPSYGSSPTFVTSATDLQVQASDAGSGVDASSCTLDNNGGGANAYSNDSVFHLTGSDGSQSYTVICADNLGNTSLGFTASKALDNTAPGNYAEHLSGASVVSGGVTYVKSNTAINVSGDDGSGSGIASCQLTNNAPVAGYVLGATFNLPTPDGSKSYTVACTDHLGNISAGFTRTRTVDDTAPTYGETVGSPSYTSAGITYVTSTTTIKVLGTDAGSGIASCTLANGGPAAAYANNSAFTLPAPDGPKSYTVICIDGLGNTDAGVSRTRTVDDTGPTISITSPIGGYALNQPVTASYTCSDAGSGVATCVGDLASGATVNTSSSALGSHSFGVAASDNLGNSSSSSTTYSIAYRFSGFFAPVDRPNTLNTSKAGQAIPLKWLLTDYFGSPVTNVTSVTVDAISYGCELGSTGDQIEEYASGSSGLQNLGGGNYQFNWKTPTSYAKSCKSISLDFGAGGVFKPAAFFSFTK